MAGAVLTGWRAGPTAGSDKIYLISTPLDPCFLSRSVPTSAPCPPPANSSALAFHKKIDRFVPRPHSLAVNSGCARTEPPAGANCGSESSSANLGTTRALNLAKKLDLLGRGIAATSQAEQKQESRREATFEIVRFSSNPTALGAFFPRVWACRCGYHFGLGARSIRFGCNHYITATTTSSTPYRLRSHAQTTSWPLLVKSPMALGTDTALIILERKREKKDKTESTLMMKDHRPCDSKTRRETWRCAAESTPPSDDALDEFFSLGLLVWPGPHDNNVTPRRAWSSPTLLIFSVVVVVVVVANDDDTSILD